MMAYCFSYGDIRRILNGFDDCGNICGIINEKDTKLGCKGSDQRKEKYLLVERSLNPKSTENPYIHRQCVKNCDFFPNYKTFLNRCVLDKRDETSTQNLLSRTGLVSFFQDVSEDLSTCWREIFYVCIISFAFSLLVLFLFRFVVAFVVWIILVASIITSVVATILLWVKYAEYKKGRDSDREKTYLISAIIATIVAIVITLIIIAMRKRIKLVIELFKEAGKAISDMPFLLFEPLLVSLI
jgi:solute carrier family 44 (choline transporter-like protein), member 1